MMLINLLPWRELRREQQKIEFFYILGGAILLTITLVVFVYLLIAGQLHAEVAANQYLNDEISSLNLKIVEIQKLKEQRLKLIERMRHVETLQAERTSTVHLFDEMVRIVPTGVYLLEMQRTGNVVLLIGKAESNSRVSEFMRNIEHSAWLAEPVLTEIKTDEEGGNALTRHFQLEMEILIAPKQGKIT